MPTSPRIAEPPTWLLLTSVGLCVAMLLAAEPALANKFETISGGVSGSASFKRDWLTKFLFIAGGVSMGGAMLAVLVPHNNALFLNFSNWKQSAAVMFVIACVLFAAAALV